MCYFNKFNNYWDLNTYQGAYHIAKVHDDEDIKKLLKNYPRPYRIPLGGFQGNYYTVNESGQLSYESSWHTVRDNVNTALKKWGDKTYGILQALINKNGKVAYFELIDEIENVLGYEFVPSYHLPRLAPRKLVFKTGSNKYPDWTMPSEIIPVVQEEINKFNRPAIPPKKSKPISNELLKIYREMGNTVDDIVKTRRELNIIFRKKFGTPLFKQNEMAIIGIRGVCSNEEEFTSRILCLTLLIDEIESKKIKKISIHKGPGSINMIESIVNQEGSSYDLRIIKNLRMTMALRSKRFPVHSDHPKYLEALNHFGFQNLSPDWQELWEIVLESYLNSLRGIIQLWSSSK